MAVAFLASSLSPLTHTQRITAHSTNHSTAQITAQTSNFLQVYSATSDLVKGIEAACAASSLGGLDLITVKDGLFSSYVYNYPFPELRWLNLW